jgi:hypothetical protein
MLNVGGCSRIYVCRLQLLHVVPSSRRDGWSVKFQVSQCNVMLNFHHQILRRNLLNTSSYMLCYEPMYNQYICVPSFLDCLCYFFIMVLCHNHVLVFSRGVHSLLYFAYTCVRDLFILEGLFTLQIIRWWYFTCKKSENIICDGILHVNMFHYCKIPYFTCTFSTKFIYNEYIRPYFLSHVVSKKFANEPPEGFLNKISID